MGVAIAIMAVSSLIVAIAVLAGPSFDFMVVGYVMQAQAFAEDVWNGMVQLSEGTLRNVDRYATPSHDAELPDTVPAVPDIVDEPGIPDGRGKLDTTRAPLVIFVAGNIDRLVNQHRAGAGLDPLTRTFSLDQIAARHSWDMADRNYFDHVNPDGLDPTDRADIARYDCTKDHGSHSTYGIAENIYRMEHMGRDDVETARYIVDGWMASAPHRAIILSPQYHETGIGVGISGSIVYATQNFC